MQNHQTTNTAVPYILTEGNSLAKRHQLQSVGSSVFLGNQSCVYQQQTPPPQQGVH